MGGVRTSDVGGFIQILLRLYLIWYFRFYHRIVWNTVKYDEHGDRSSDISVSHTQNVIYLYIKIKLKTNRNLIQASKINKFSFCGFWKDLKITFKKLFKFFWEKKKYFEFLQYKLYFWGAWDLISQKISQKIFKYIWVGHFKHFSTYLRFLAYGRNRLKL